MLHDSDPSVEDIHGDVHVRTSALPDELSLPAQDADAFPGDRLSDDELERLWIAEQAERDAATGEFSGFSESRRITTAVRLPNSAAWEGPPDKPAA